MDNKHFVAIRLGVLGDVALTTGVFSYLHKIYGYTFSVITRSMFAPLFENNPAILAVHALPNTISFSTLLKEAYTLSKVYPTTPLIDLHGNLRSAIFKFIWKAPVITYPKMSKERRKFIQTKDALLSKVLCETSVTQRYFLAFAPYIHSHSMPLPTPENLAPSIYISENEYSAVINKFSPPKTCIALHPYASHATKMWPMEYWKKLAILLKQQGYSLIVLGRDSTPFTSEAVSLEDNCTNRTTIRESLALLHHAKLLITADSGLLHLASAVNTPSVALFGPTVKEWGFFPPQPSIVLENISTPCRPCSLHGKELCPFSMECMFSLEPEYVCYKTHELYTQLFS